jgi:cytoplasmic iron level regulating protein YaaA (DUF328/UPF0246 family)
VSRVLILLPPSEGKTAPRRGKPLDPAALSFPALAAARGQVLDALVALCAGAGGGRTDAGADPLHAAGVLGLGPTQAGEVARNTGLRAAPTARADAVYSGVLFEALGLSSLTGPARGRATRWLAISSGLFGLLRPGDRIPAYRLAGDVTLPGVGNVATFWSRQLAPVVTEAAGAGLVVDLRSSTYAGFWRPDPATARRTATVRVLHEVDGTRKVVSHFNKATKGRIVRALLEDGTIPRTPAALADQLAGLGWKVELGDATKHGTRLDVVVTDL